MIPDEVLHRIFPYLVHRGHALLTDLPGILAIDAAFVVLAVIIWGTFKRQTWAWWGALAYYGIITLSTIWTFARLTWVDILSVMRFAPTEMEALGGIPAHGLHIAAFVGLPLLATLGWILYSRRFFGAHRRADSLRYAAPATQSRNRKRR